MENKISFREENDECEIDENINIFGDQNFYNMNEP
jgi:hypothetical protein